MRAPPVQLIPVGAVAVVQSAALWEIGAQVWQGQVTTDILPHLHHLNDVWQPVLVHVPQHRSAILSDSDLLQALRWDYPVVIASIAAARLLPPIEAYPGGQPVDVKGALEGIISPTGVLERPKGIAVVVQDVPDTRVDGCHSGWVVLDSRAVWVLELLQIVVRDHLSRGLLVSIEEEPEAQSPYAAILQLLFDRIWAHGLSLPLL